MPIFHCSVICISRGKGRSATAAAAYRAAEKIIDERTGLVHDYTHKQGVVHKEIMTPKDVTFEGNRQGLWNLVEASEKRLDSRVAREIRVALPHELNTESRIKLTREFVDNVVARYGVVADICIHEPNKEGDHRNHHAHLMLSTRKMTPEGFGKKVRILDDKIKGPQEIRWIRERWAEITNRYLEQSQVLDRLDHRSYEAQGVTKIPGIHLGPGATAMERDGDQSERGNQLSDREYLNHKLQMSKTNEANEVDSKETQKQKFPDKELVNSDPSATDLSSFEALRVQKTGPLNHRISTLQQRITQELSAIRDQRDELQEVSKSLSKGFIVFKRQKLDKIQVDLIRLEQREDSIKTRYQQLRRYADKDLFGPSPLENRVRKECKRENSELFERIEKRRLDKHNPPIKKGPTKGLER